MKYELYNFRCILIYNNIIHFLISLIDSASLI